MTTKVDKSLFSAFIPKEYADKVIDNGVPDLGDEVELVCVYANPEDGYGLKFRRKSRIILP